MPSPTPRLIVATRNAHKTAEIRSMLGGKFEVVDATAFPEFPEIEETGTTFLENARLKAEGISRLIDGWVLSDDSGLEVDALDGAPGIYSARWAGESKNFTEAMTRIERLLQERGADTPDKRKAHFVSALCVAWPDGHLEEVEAHAHGTLVWPVRGDAGFGYDPSFQPDGHDRTYGEMSAIEKHGLPPLGEGLSHRAQAFVKLAEICLDPR